MIVRGKLIASITVVAAAVTACGVDARSRPPYHGVACVLHDFVIVAVHGTPTVAILNDSTCVGKELNIFSDNEP